MQWLRLASMMLLWMGGCRLALASDIDGLVMPNNLDRAGWPDALTHQAELDTLSRAKVLMLGKALLASERLDERDLEQRLGVPVVRLASIRQVRDDLWNGLLSRYRSASQNCEGQPFCPRMRGVSDLRQLAAAFTGDISPAHAAWASRSQALQEQVLNDRLRLAMKAP